MLSDAPIWLWASLQVFLWIFLEALEFHARQGLVSERADRWVSGANRGLCEELLGNAKEAYSLYQQAEQEIELQSEQESAG